jgi:hypothetical protein
MQGLIERRFSALVAQASAWAVLISLHRNIKQAKACATKSHPYGFSAPLQRFKDHFSDCVARNQG